MIEFKTKGGAVKINVSNISAIRECLKYKIVNGKNTGSAIRDEKTEIWMNDGRLMFKVLESYDEVIKKIDLKEKINESVKEQE